MLTPMNPGEVYALVAQAQEVAGNVTLTLNTGELITGMVDQFHRDGTIIVANRRIHATAVDHVSLDYERPSSPPAPSPREQYRGWLRELDPEQFRAADPRPPFSDAAVYAPWKPEVYRGELNRRRRGDA